MAKLTIFIHAHGRSDVLEGGLEESATIGELYGLLEGLGIKVDGETFVFVDEFEEHLGREHHHPVHGLKHGSRIHVCRCRRVKVLVNYLEKTAERAFAPGARVRAVKEWAVQTFKLSPKDAAEHVLQLCGSTKRPPTDTRLSELLTGHDCSLCFDLVPEKRVEG